MSPIKLHRSFAVAALVALTALVPGASLVAEGTAAERQAPPEGGQPKDFSLPRVERFELENGLRATLVPFGHVPKVQVRVVVRTGNIDEGQGQRWLSDLLGNMLEEGAGDMDSAQLAEAFAALGGQLRVGVGVDSIFLSSDALSEMAPRLIERLAQVATAPALPESELERRKNDLVRQLAVARVQPARQATRRFLEELYGDHPYGGAYPEDETLRGYTLEQLRAFYDENFGAARTHLYVVGVFDGDAVRAEIEKAFGDWRAGEPATVNPPEVTLPTATATATDAATATADAADATAADDADDAPARRIVIVDRPGAEQSTIRLGLPVIDPSHEDYLPLRVTNTLLGGSFTSRITSNIREDKGYTYSPNASLSSNYRSGTWVQQADVTTEVTGAALREIFAEIDRLQAEAPPESELEATQNYLAGTFVYRNSNPFGIAFQLYFVDLHGLATDYLTSYVKDVHAVTPEQVRRIAATYLLDEQMVLVVVGDEAKIRDQLEPFGDIVVE